MGMSIDEAIGLLERGSQYNYYDSAEDFCKAYDMAIETMRKYQKIEQIYHMWNEVNDFSYNQAMREIGEVVEDGKID